MAMPVPHAAAMAGTIASLVNLVTNLDEFNFYWEDRVSLTRKAIRVDMGTSELIIDIHPGTSDVHDYLFDFGHAYTRGVDHSEAHIETNLTVAQLNALSERLDEQFHTDIQYAYEHRNDTPATVDGDWRATQKAKEKKEKEKDK
ncbi:hypothetical protein [Yinghuangia soli]|uniref:Uncharacterized protein n=1 Tax=Yinghuangia soli TaxID=2908204 RepID=A0AA41Q9U2_9ACTN|nr:hypothetical protein [Yinghuangia soli]MCF2533019.1 hypothetical protein [Yinghuangia soli]